MSEQTVDPRGTWTHSSDAEADASCPGRHQAIQGVPKRDKDAAAKHGDAIHQALAKQDPTNLTPDQATLYDACNEIVNRVIHKDLFPGVADLKLLREQRLWLTLPVAQGIRDRELKHSGQFDLIVVASSVKRAAVIDYKTLAGQVQESADNLQLRDGVDLANGHYGPFDLVHCLIVQPLVSHQPEICDYAPEHIKMAHEGLVERVTKSNAPDAQRTPGDRQCHFCAANRYCPQFAQWQGDKLPVLSEPQQAVWRVPMANWTPVQRAICAEALPMLDKFLKDAKMFLKAGMENDKDFCPGFYLKPLPPMKPVGDPWELFRRWVTLKGDPKAFFRAVSVGKGEFAEEMKALVGMNGKQLEKVLDTIYEGLIVETPKAPTIAKMK